ncbi:unnamed protein product [Sympodiomycopsis kandeliae]
MVFIVKIPNKLQRSASQEETQQVKSEESHQEHQPGLPHVDDHVEAGSGPGQNSHADRGQDVQDALDALQKLSLGLNSTDHPAGTPPRSQGAQSEQVSQHVEHRDLNHPGHERSTSKLSTVKSPTLDVIVAPAVLAHRYVRGNDTSLIVERPERVRAVLLGISAVLGRLGTEDEQINQPNTTANRKQAGGSDDLVSQLAGMSVGNKEDDNSRVRNLHSPVQVLHSTRSISFHPSHPALSAIHGHEDELVTWDLPECETRRRLKHHKTSSERTDGSPEVDKTPSQTPMEKSFTDWLPELCSFAPHSPPILPPPVESPQTRRIASAMSTPTGRTRSTTAKDLLHFASANTSPSKSLGGYQDTDHASRDLAPSAFSTFANAQPRTPHQEHDTLSLPSQAVGESETPREVENDGGKSSSSSSSSDDEGEELHPSEVPASLNQGDLYLRGSKRATQGQTKDLTMYGSAEAIQHALGASLEAVDRVIVASRLKLQPASQTATGNAVCSPQVNPMVFSPGSENSAEPCPAATRAFVLTRPPGHHCSGSAPSGFCWVNNVAVAAMHAYQAHGIDRVMIFDIDLHHGNGTQKIVWRINEETRRQDIERQARLEALRTTFAAKSKSTGRGRGGRKSGGGESSTTASSIPTFEQEAAKLPPRGLQIFYGSLHDIESFPCEDGDADLVRDASTCIEGAHGQWIWNTHLDTYTTEQEFQSLYNTKYSQLFSKARAFASRTDASPDKTLVMISCGFDACSYELQGMQRHGKNVPPGFYHRFAQDSVTLAEELAQGKLISSLEGGYGDRALCSASIAHLKGLSEEPRHATSSQNLSEQSAVFVERRTIKTVSISSGCIDPYADSWWSIDSLKALEKLMAKRIASNAAASGGKVATSSVARKKPASAASAAEPSWLKAAGQHFDAFEGLCEPLMRGFGPKITTNRRR